MAKRGKSGGKNKKASRRKKSNPADAEARVLAAYGLGAGCTFSDSENSDREDKSPSETEISSQGGGLGSGLTAPWNGFTSKQTKSPRADHSLVDLHLHSTCSDGLLSPTELVRKAARNGVRIMALTDHDTMAGIEEAARAGAECGVRVIPGVEISAFASTAANPLQGEVVHILAYFPPGGPSNPGDFHRALLRIRTGRLERAKCMVEKLRALGKVIELSKVLKIAGPGVAPGRPHVARALVEAGHVASEGDAFKLYLGDQGPAFARGSEIPAIDAVQLIRKCGGVSVLAHPWSIKKDPMAVVGRLTAAGLDGLEVYQDSTKIATYGPLADMYSLIKVGGSDFHGTGAADEREPGKIPLPIAAVEKLLQVAEPIWEEALRSRVRAFVEEERGECNRIEGTLEGRKASTEGSENLDREGVLADRADEKVHMHIDMGALEGGESQVGVSFMTWTVAKSNGRQMLRTPLLLTRTDRDIVRDEAAGEKCQVEESNWKGYKFLILSADAKGT